MRLHKLIWAILLVLLPTSGRVLAAISLTNDEYYVLEGMPFTITWSNNRGPVTVTLMKGPDANLEQVLVLVTGSPAQEFTWTPPPTLAAGSYELQVEDSGSADYSPRFQYPAPPLPSSSTTSTASGPTVSRIPPVITFHVLTNASLPRPELTNVELHHHPLLHIHLPASIATNKRPTSPYRRHCGHSNPRGPPRHRHPCIFGVLYPQTTQIPSHEGGGGGRGEL